MIASPKTVQHRFVRSHLYNNIEIASYHFRLIDKPSKDIRLNLDIFEHLFASGHWAATICVGKSLGYDWFESPLLGPFRADLS